MAPRNERGGAVLSGVLPPPSAVRPPLAHISALPWEDRLYDGLRVGCVADETRQALAQALGAAGVEAEYLLLLAIEFGGGGLLPRAKGEAFLIRLEAACRRVVHASVTLEIATQGFLAALESGYPGIRGEAEAADPWWPAFPGYALPGEPVELRLRRCGYSYRHAVAAHLGPSLEGLTEQMALILHALTNMPPAGIAPASGLYSGLYEISSTLQGYAVPTHITSASAERPGLLAGIARLIALNMHEGTSLDADIAWAQEQYRSARLVQASGPGYVGRTADAQRWAARTSRDWLDLIASLESLQAHEQATHRRF